MNKILPSVSLFGALEKLNALSGGIMTLLVVDGDGRLVGTLTDGDVRRALLRGVSMQSRVSDVMRRDFRALSYEEPDNEAYLQMRRQGLRLIPLIDRNGRLKGTVDSSRIRAMLPIRAMLMAGGRGERLRPLTLTVPKPLLKVGGKPIIDRNIAILASYGITDVTVSVNYLAEQLEEHFSTPCEGIDVATVRESFAMGTIGSASLLPQADPEGCTLVMNSDLLTSIRLDEMYDLHHRSGADVTIAVTPYNVSVPYAIVDEDEDGKVVGLSEKPSFSYNANAGIYIFSNRLLASLPKDSATDAPDLIQQAIADGGTVVTFPIDGTWLDIGSPTEYARACELMSRQDCFD